MQASGRLQVTNGGRECGFPRLASLNLSAGATVSSHQKCWTQRLEDQFRIAAAAAVVAHLSTTLLRSYDPRNLTFDATKIRRCHIVTGCSHDWKRELSSAT